jgi:uncharacterized protein (DUF362 family)
VDIAKLKSHSFAFYTGAVKNMYGAVPGTQKARYHSTNITPVRFCELVLDICETVRPHFCVIDGVCGMEGNGPSGGKCSGAT